MKLVCFCALILGQLALPSAAGIGLQEFYITDAGGSVFSVDGNSFQATQLFEMDSASLISDLHYIGGNQIVAHNNGVFTRFDVTSNDGAGTVLYDLHPFFEPGISFANGIDYDAQGRVHFSIDNIMPNGTSVAYNVTYDPATDSYTRHDDYDRTVYLLDVHQFEDDVFLGAHFNENSAIVYNSLTGVTIDTHQLDFGVVSFFDVGNQTIAIGKEGGVYSLDPLSGSTSQIGEIQGAGRNIIGATVPTPAGCALLGFAGLMGTRRRR